MVNVQEPAEVVRRFAKKNSLPFPILLDTDGRVSYAYSIRSHPMAFLIDGKGDVLGVAPGYREWDKKEMKALIRSLISTDGAMG